MLVISIDTSTARRPDLAGRVGQAGWHGYSCRDCCTRRSRLALAGQPRRQSVVCPLDPSTGPCTGSTGKPVAATTVGTGLARVRAPGRFRRWRLPAAWLKAARRRQNSVAHRRGYGDASRRRTPLRRCHRDLVMTIALQNAGAKRHRSPRKSPENYVGLQKEHTAVDLTGAGDLRLFSRFAKVISRR